MPSTKEQAKKKSTLIGIDRVPKDKLIVIKSNPLTSLWRSELTLSEFKILDTYLARINSHEPEKRQVEITKEEFEKVFGISKFNLKELDARLQHLVGQAVRISDGDYRSGFAWISLFEQARVEADENGVQTVYLECTQSAMKYFFNCESLGYLRYKLQSIKDMRSRYTFILFIYLEKNRFRTEWTVSLDDLKLILNCENDDTYTEYKRFNEKIMKRSQEEITKKTECRFEYIPIRKGRRVTDIHFVVKPLSPEIPDAADPEQLIPDESGENDIEALLSKACNNEFSAAEIRNIRTELYTVPDTVLPYLKHTDNMDLRRCNYFQQRYNTMVIYSTQFDIKNRYKYIMAMIKNDTKT